MRGDLKSWLQLFRAQTLPATALLALVPYLHGGADGTTALLLVILSAALHYFSYGHNSLMDYASDMKDPAKSHHPLMTGRIPLREAHVVVHGGLALALLGAVVLTLTTAESKLGAMTSLFLYCVFGHAYNDGLSKTTVFAFFPLALCGAALAAWGWFLSHAELDVAGMALLAYDFVLLSFQISYSGCLKEIQVAEDSNLLIRLGGRVEAGAFRGGGAAVYGTVLTALNLGMGGVLLATRFSRSGLAWCLLAAGATTWLTFQLVRDRTWERGRELMRISLREIAVIYLPIPILLDPLTAGVLMAAGVVYFFCLNRWLWGWPYPAV